MEWKNIWLLLGKNLDLIDSMQLMNCSLESLVKNWPKNKFKHLSQEFSKKQLELVKQKAHYSYGYIRLILKNLMKRTYKK